MKKDVHAESAAALIDEKIKELGDWRVRPDGQSPKSEHTQQIL
jgi:hypothetical protein